MVTRKWCSAVSLALVVAFVAGCAGGPSKVSQPGPSPSAAERQPPSPAATAAVSLPATPEISKEVPLSAFAKLVGYTVRKAANGQTEILLYWQCLKPMSTDYKVFVHLYPANRSVLAANRQTVGYANIDNAPRVPTFKWQAGKTYVSLHRGKVNPAAYKTAIGFYSVENGTGVRVTPAAAGVTGAPEKLSITIGTITVS